MITPELVKRINELANKKKKQGLTLAEQAEQKRLYGVYLDAIREQVKVQLDNIEIIPEGHGCDVTCYHQHDPGCSCNHQHGTDDKHDHQHGSDCKRK